MNVVGYIRVSSRGQLDGDGPQRQRDAIIKFCTAHGLKLRWEYLEEGVSGTTEGMDRQAFSDMVVDIERRKSDDEAVVVERLDRLARDLMVSEVLLKELRTRGIKVFAADQGALIDLANDAGDPTRKLIRQIIGALAEWEKSQLVLKLRIARERKKAAGGHANGHWPYGQTGNPQDCAEQQILNLIFAWRKLGFSFSRIAGLLNEGGFKTRFGTTWKKIAVFDLFKRTQQRKKKPCAARIINT